MVFFPLPFSFWAFGYKYMRPYDRVLCHEDCFGGWCQEGSLFKNLSAVVWTLLGPARLYIQGTHGPGGWQLGGWAAAGSAPTSPSRQGGMGRLCRDTAVYPEELWAGRHCQHRNEGRERAFCFFINSYNSPDEQWEEPGLPGQRDHQRTECATFSKLISFALKKKKM